MNDDAVTRFLCAVRRRLWLAQALRQLRTALWVSSGALVLLALVHIGWSPLRFSVVLTGATVVGLIAMLPAILARPTLADCALQADRHFNGHSLITTAHELGRLSELPSAGQTVLSRAMSMADDWRPGLGGLWRAPHSSTFVFAIVPAFFAALLLELPPRDDRHTATIPGNQTGAPGSVAADGDLFDEAGNTTALRDAIARSSIDQNRPAGPNVALANDVSPVSDDARSRVAAEMPRALETDALPPGIAGAANDGGPGPGDARRHADASEKQGQASPPLRALRSDTAIALDGAAAAGRGPGVDEYSAPTHASAVARRRIVPAAAPPAAGGWTVLTAAEVAYARRYLDEAGLPHE